MGCTDCKKTKKTKLNNIGFPELDINHNLPNTPVFSGFWGRLFYFLILAFIAVTPIINLAALYVFYRVVYGKNNSKKIENAKEHQDTNESQ